MSKQIKLTRASTNLRVLDKVKNTQTYEKYRVMNIDLNEARVVLLGVSYDDAGLVVGYSSIPMVVNSRDLHRFEIVN